MAYYSPLRYPGGKRRLIHTIKALIEANGLHDLHYVEPFSGGASVALALLFEAHASEIHINDLDPAVHAFWHCAVHRSEELAVRIENTSLSIREWKRQRSIYQAAGDAEVLDLAFATLYLNRTNRSGILCGGVIGGLRQNGPWKLDARFNPRDLAGRVRQIGRFRSSIHVHQLDASKLIRKVITGLPKNSLAFFDPPYIIKGGSLYLDRFDVEGHRRLASNIEKIRRPWVVTYDYEAVREQLFYDRRRIVYDLHYVANKRSAGREVMFFSDGLSVPSLDELAGPRMRSIPSLCRFRD